MKENGTILTLSDFVNIGVYRFKKYEILGVDRSKRQGTIVGHDDEKPFEVNRPIAPTEKCTVSDREILDSLLTLASKAIPICGEKSDKLIRSWCEKYGLPACSVEESRQVGYLAFPLYRFYDFLFLLRDTFWKAESIYSEDFPQKYDIDLFTENPYKKRDAYFTKENKEDLISCFINETNMMLCFEYRNGKPTFYNYAPDIISLVRYQFALILLSNGESVPRRCKCCGSMFFAHRKNQLYGPCCSRQKRYAAEKRRKERERKHNG